ncbi:MAG: T9SS type A sorting domain-containing protein [Cyclobacteriaceae bacterium]
MKKISFFVIVFYAFLWSGIEYRTYSNRKTTVSPLFKKISKTDKPAQFLEFHRGIRTRENTSAPEYEQNYKWKELRQAKQHAAARRRSSSGRTKSNGVLAWVERGPGNVPGRTRALLNVAGDPANNTWLAGSATGGIWATSDGGLSWSEKSKDFPALPISSFASTADGAVIYAATGEFVSSIFSSVGNGIFKSVDKGQTWQQLPSTNNNPEFSVVTRVITNPADGNVIVASTVPHNLASDNSSSIMRSIDGGVTWTKVKEIFGVFEQVIASSHNFNIQYASQNRVGVWKSTDAGVTWNLFNDGMSPSGRVEIGVSPVNPNILFASAEGTLSGNGSDLYYSQNAGASWSLVDVMFTGETVDFLEGQGFYDNTVLCDPFNASTVYFGGVSLFRATVGTVASTVDNWKITENGTADIIFLQSFQDIEWDNERLTVDNSKPKINVQLRFGPGKAQKAHRFFVPAGATSGVDAASYTYQDYVSVPFEAWDVTNPSNPRQLMISFRDQNRNGFDLVPQKLSDTDPPLQQSREYLYIHSLTYHPTIPSSQVTVNGGQEKSMAYNIFPALAPGATWPTSIPTSQIEIKYTGLSKYNATTITSADGRGSFDSKNTANQVHLEMGVHPDHHFMVAVIVDPSAKTYRIILGNDGGVFVSRVSANPGAVEGDWLFKGIGYNTSQFYGADKRPGVDQYIGGIQDNGTRISPSGQDASAASAYEYAIGGDGFEVLWNNKDDNKILGSVYYGQISRTNNGGNSWQTATNGLNPGNQDFPFVTKLANSKDFPDRVFTVGRKGVYVSNDFGETWKLTAIGEKFVTGAGFFVDVEVSRANSNIVWAGSGMSNTEPAFRHLHVSKDGGQTFLPTQNYTTVTLGNISKLASHPTEENTAYALFSFSGNPKILRTTNLGQSWEDISGFASGVPGNRGFPDVAVYSLYVRPDNPDIIWAGTEIGIVESTDNGESWALVEDFPNVTVFDMKGQDNQVVIATHGRGIWTANLEADQVTGKTPVIMASGTSPSGDLMLRIQSVESYDSLQVVVESALIKTYYNLSPGIIDFSLDNISPGNKNIRMISYKGTVPFQSGIHKTSHMDVLPPKNSYSTYFNTLNELQVTGLSLQNFAGGMQQRKTLHTSHDYSVAQTYELIIRTPVRVSATMPVLFYRDIGIIEPENDSITLEATKNGLDWIPLAPSYDAAFAGDESSAWKNAYMNQRQGNPGMFVKHEIDFSDKFSVEDLILFRFRLISGPLVTSWGWALDYVSIQEQPVAEESAAAPESALAIYPNPSTGKLTLDYILKKPSEISVKLIDIYGKSSPDLLTGKRNAGFNTENLDLSDLQPGTYIIMLRSSEGKMVGKVAIIR